MDDWYSSEGNPDLWGLDCEFIEMDNPSCWQSADKTDEQRKEISRRALAREAGMRCDFSQKLDHTCRVINKALQRLPQEQWCLSWSAGNDSTALSLFLRKYMGLKITHVMSNTRLEYPETIRNMHRYKAELEVRLPHRTSKRQREQSAGTPQKQHHDVEQDDEGVGF